MTERKLSNEQALDLLCKLREDRTNAEEYETGVSNMLEYVKSLHGIATCALHTDHLVKILHPADIEGVLQYCLDGAVLRTAETRKAFKSATL